MIAIINSLDDPRESLVRTWDIKCLMSVDTFRFTSMRQLLGMLGIGVFHTNLDVAP
jgi:hypothetical protein